LLASTPLQDSWLTGLESTDLQVTGWVDAIPEPLYRRTRFYLEVDQLYHQNQRIPLTGRLRLYWYDNPPVLQVGDQWSLTVRLRKPRGLANPGGFDYERWLFVNGIVAQGYVRPWPKPQRLAEAVRYPVDRFRQRLAERIARELNGNAYTGIITALAIGERQGISNAQWQLLSQTGTGHLIAISGLHVGLIAGLIFAGARYVWSRSTTLVKRWPASKAAALAALLGAIGYALLAGMALPTQRALIMLTIVLISVLGQRPIVPSRVLALALLGVLIVDPNAPLSGGFWLSFGAVAVIFYTLTGRRPMNRPLHSWLTLQCSITLALLPAVLILFQQLPVLSPVANLIAIPWASVTVIPLTLLAVLAGFVSETAQAGLLQLAALTMDWLWSFLSWLGELPGIKQIMPSPPLWTLLFCVPGLVLLLAPKGMPGRWLGGVLCLPLLCFPRPVPAPGEVWFTLLDVGDGLSAVVRTANHKLVYDTGPRRGSSFDAGRVALVPFLRQQGVTEVDTLLISHADNAHQGGTRALLEQFAVQRILTSSPLDVPVQGAKPCQAGMTWVWDQVRFGILHPPAQGSFSDDEASCVLLVEAAGGRILLPGDIEASAKTALVKAYGDDLKAQILVAPHHGTRSLSSPLFVNTVQPDYVLFSTGYQSRSKPSKLERRVFYETQGATVLDTVDEGAITFRLGSSGELFPESYRRQFRRYWHSL
jgi:competence protein ComEC